MKNSFCTNGFLHIICPPDDKSVWFRVCSVAPLETVEYGKSPNGEYYRKQEILEGLCEGESFLQILSEQTFKKVVLQEIALCETCGQDHEKQMLKKLLKKQ